LFCEIERPPGIDRDCGALLHRMPEDGAALPQGYHVLCYIALNDTARVFTPCEFLISDLPFYDDAHGLVLAGGNYGCWVGDRYPHPQQDSSCHDDYQHDKTLASCSNCILMTVCLRYPGGAGTDQLHRNP
jgi:hypothetical protein